ncbi:PAS domain-containing protein [Belnapia sp. T6]|uniref:histidine kinase n=1 Tax=Belnapia mucosa TaxID=2804532 RepID=A0ABS1V8W4_9PROT|nr:PAS domain-containing protein [Belnapia mucosa]MBL6457189.1 PAS domain-containing protein [Belnapia mucosa]
MSEQPSSDPEDGGAKAGGGDRGGPWRRASTVLLAAVALLPLAVAGIRLWSARDDAQVRTRAELARAADAAAEYAGRVLDTHRIMVMRLDDTLHGITDAEIRAREEALHQKTRALLAQHPGLSGFVHGRDGRLLLATNLYPVPPNLDLSDREFSQALRQADPPETHVSRIYRGRAVGQTFFAVSRRRTETGSGLPPTEYDGLVNVSVYPRDLAAGLTQLTRDEGDVLTLVRSDGEILARSTGLDAPLPPIPPERPIVAAMRRGDARIEAETDGSIAAARRVAGWPVYAVTSRPRGAIRAQWLASIAWEVPISLLASALLCLLARTIHRQQQRLRRANLDLEARVEWRTRELATSEERLLLAQDAGGIGSWEIEPQNLRMLASASQLRLYGLPEDAFPDGLGWEAWLAMLHPEDRDRAAARRRAALDSRATYSDEFRIRRADTGEERVILARARWIRRQGAAGERFIGISIDVTERKAAEQEIAGREAEFRAIFENSAIGNIQCDAASLRLTRANACFRDVIGAAAGEPLTGLSLLDIVYEDDRARWEPAFRATLAGGQPYQGEVRFRRRDGAIRWACITASLVPQAGRQKARLIAAVQDVTDRHLAEERQMLLAREVDHRSKNALAVVQAALRLTTKDDAQAFAAAISGRVGALARAQTLLAQGRWTGADLRTLVEAELAGFINLESGPRIGIAGPPLTVSAEAAQPISMVLHELATNAVKYGALSVAEGAVSIAWRLDGAADQLLFDWVETGGPAIAGAPRRAGFGSRLLKATLRQLGGSLSLDWRPAGLACTLDLPLSRIVQRDGPEPEPEDAIALDQATQREPV